VHGALERQQDVVREQRQCCRYDDAADQDEQRPARLRRDQFRHVGAQRPADAIPPRAAPAAREQRVEPRGRPDEARRGVAGVEDRALHLAVDRPQALDEAMRPTALVQPPPDERVQVADRVRRRRVPAEPPRRQLGAQRPVARQAEVPAEPQFERVDVPSR
jgi:hypothetical protein